MGNTFASQKDTVSEVSASELSYFTPAEVSHLKQAYVQLKHGDSDVIDFFSLHTRPVLRSRLVEHFTSNIVSYKEFEDFVAHTARLASSDSVTTFWGLIPPSEQQNLRMLCSMIIEASLVEDSYDHVNTVVERVCEFLETTARARGVNLAGDGIAISSLISLLNNHLPFTGKVLESFVSKACLKGLHSPSYQPFLCPALDTPSEVANAADLVPLALHSKALQGQWKRLYSTSVDGLSFNRISYHCLGYDGPTCLLIRCMDPQQTVLGAVSYDRWKDSNRFYGSSQNALFVLAPTLRLYRGKGASNGTYQWLNTKSPTLPRGMGFGGTTEGFRLFIPESLEGCIAAHSCPTYEAGKLIDGERFEIHTLEVWGCGGQDTVAAALQAQQQERDKVDENIRKARQVDKAQFFNNEFDREFFLSNTTSYGDKDRTGPA